MSRSEKTTPSFGNNATHPGLEGDRPTLHPPTPVDPATPTTLETPEAAQPSAPPKRRPPLLTLLLVGVGLMVGGVLGGRWWVYAASHETTDNAQLAGHLYPISSRIPGTVAQVAVDENQRVTQGELLVQLDRHDYEVAV